MFITNEQFEVSPSNWCFRINYRLKKNIIFAIQYKADEKGSKQVGYYQNNW